MTLSGWVGLSLSHPIGQSVIAYAEWAGARQCNLITQAVTYGKETATLPANAPTLPPTDSAAAFRNDVAVGASWAGAAKITINLEYHYYQAGFSPEDWRHGFAIGGAQRSIFAVTGELWLVRGFASDLQQPVAQQQLFLRAERKDAFVTNLTLSGFAFVSLRDASSLTQLAASYYLSDRVTIAAYFAANVGTPQSERGSLPQATSTILQLVGYS